jgi:hypothetical protein
VDGQIHTQLRSPYVPRWWHFILQPSGLRHRIFCLVGGNLFRLWSRKKWKRYASQISRQLFTDLMFCWPCIIVYQYNKTNVMHVSFNLLRIKVSWLWHGWSFTLYALSVPNAVCVASPEDEQVLLETCRGPWFSVNWMKSTSRFFYYTDKLSTDHTTSQTRRAQYETLQAFSIHTFLKVTCEVSYPYKHRVKSFACNVWSDGEKLKGKYYTLYFSVDKRRDLGFSQSCRVHW